MTHGLVAEVTQGCHISCTFQANFTVFGHPADSAEITPRSPKMHDSSWKRNEFCTQNARFFVEIHFSAIFNREMKKESAEMIRNTQTRMKK